MLLILNSYTLAPGASSPSPLVEAAATEAKYEMTFFVFSVLPAPDSPLYHIVSK